jgi:predicted RNase H-like HicB family nuclease
MAAGSEVELIFEPDPDGGYHAYAPELPGLHTEGDTLEGAMANAQEALDLYVEGMREEGRSLDMGVVRRTLPLPARVDSSQSSLARSSSARLPSEAGWLWVKGEAMFGCAIQPGPFRLSCPSTGN